jgi:hypothetical protein
MTCIRPSNCVSSSAVQSTNSFTVAVVAVVQEDGIMIR